jgi:hypothetical protein
MCWTEGVPGRDRALYAKYGGLIFGKGVGGACFSPSGGIFGSRLVGHGVEDFCEVYADCLKDYWDALDGACLVWGRP